MKEMLLGDGFHSRVIEVARGHFDKKDRHHRVATRVSRRSVRSGEVSFKFSEPSGPLLDRFDSRVIVECNSRSR